MHSSGCHHKLYVLHGVSITNNRAEFVSASSNPNKEQVTRTNLFRTLNPSEDKASNDKCRGNSRIESPVKSRRHAFQVEILVRRAVANSCYVQIMRSIDEIYNTICQSQCATEGNDGVLYRATSRHAYANYGWEKLHQDRTRLEMVVCTLHLKILTLALYR